MSYVKSKFSVIENEYIGYHNPEIIWNGWACPLFTKDQASLIMDEANTDTEGDKYNWEGEVVKCTHIDGGATLTPPQEIEVDGELITVYALGYSQCTWQEIPTIIIETVQDVRTFFDNILNDGVIFHPDTDFADYITYTEQRAYTDQEAEKFNALMSQCFDVCKRANVDIYEIALNVLSNI